jgi:hypothetical protein
MGRSDLGDQILLKIQSAQNRFKMNRGVDLIVKNPTHFERFQITLYEGDIVFCSIFQTGKNLLTVQSVQLLTWKAFN